MYASAVACPYIGTRGPLTVLVKQAQTIKEAPPPGRCPLTLSTRNFSFSPRQRNTHTAFRSIPFFTEHSSDQQIFDQSSTVQCACSNAHSSLAAASLSFS